MLAIARRDQLDCYALSIRYGQRHSHELDCALQVGSAFGVSEHQIVDLDLSAFGGSSLFESGGEVPKDNPEPGESGAIPSTYVPARNTVFLSLALGWAEVLDADAVYVGVNALDYSGYPDCRPEYLEAYQRVADLATRRGVEGRPIEVRAPLLHLGKSEIIRRGLELGVDYAMTSSCYEPMSPGSPCGRCDACVLRRRGFQGAGAEDPLPYPSRETTPGGS